MEGKSHWERVYGAKSSDQVSWYQPIPTVSIDLIRALDLRKDAPVIDVGAGASRLVDWLLDSGFSKVVVLDISRTALDATKERLGDRASQVHWIEADVTTFDPAPTDAYLLWHDRAVFHFLTEKSDRSRYVETLKRALAVGGYLILASFAIGGPTRCSGLNVEQYDAAKLQLELGGSFELLSSRDEDHVTPTGAVQKFAYFVLRRKS